MTTEHNESIDQEYTMVRVCQVNNQSIRDFTIAMHV